MLTKEQLLQSRVEREKVELLGDFVYVRGMTGTELDSWQQMVMYHRKKSDTDSFDNFRASLVLRTVCDENGSPLFGPNDIKEVGKMPAAVIDKLWDVAARLSAITEPEAEKIGKNSMSGQSEVSTST